MTILESHSEISPTALEKLEFVSERRGLRRDLTGPRTSLRFEPHLAGIVAHRRTARTFAAGAVHADSLAGLLSVLRATSRDDAPIAEFGYPSASSLYPVQTYVLVKPDRVAGLEAGLYYYDWARHELQTVDLSFELPAAVVDDVNRGVFQGAAFALVFLLDLNAIAPFYGDNSMDLARIEVGGMAQLLMLAAPQENLGLCPIGHLPLEQGGPRPWLKPSHRFLHAMFGGGLRSAGATVRHLSPATAPDHPADPQPNASTDLQLRAATGEALGESLPSHMVPLIYEIDEMPLNANGKVDRQKLAELAAGLQQERRVAYAAPETELQKALVDIWHELLGVEQVGIRDDFFEMGGESAVWIQLSSVLLERFGVEVSMRDMLQNPTIEQVAAFIEERRANPEARSAPLTLF